VIQLHEAIVKAIQDRLMDVYTAMPGRIEKWDWAKGSAHVKPLIQEIQDTSGKYKPLPVIAGVPVMFPSAAAGGLTFPIAVGDTGLLIFTKHALEVWLSRGGDVAPGDPREFDLSDAVFLPGLRPFTAENPAESASALTLKNGRAKLKITGDKIAIGNDVAELLQIVSDLLTVIVTGTNAGGPLVFTPAAGPGSIPDLLIKLNAIKGSL
jgi:hypothetical protein